MSASPNSSPIKKKLKDNNSYNAKPDKENQGNEENKEKCKRKITTSEIDAGSTRKKIKPLLRTGSKKENEEEEEDDEDNKKDLKTKIKDFINKDNNKDNNEEEEDENEKPNIFKRMFGF